jgi:hypothetical protein
MSAEEEEYRRKISALLFYLVTVGEIAFAS